MSYISGSVEHFWGNFNNKGKKMNEQLETEYAQAFKDEVKIKLDAQGNPIVPVNSSATMEFKTENVNNEG